MYSGCDVLLYGAEVECLHSIQCVGFPEVAALQLVFAFQSEVDGSSVIVDVRSCVPKLRNSMFDVCWFGGLSVDEGEVTVGGKGMRVYGGGDGELA